MSLDNALRAIAFAEASTLGGAVALIAKHRNDLDAALRAAALKEMPVASEGAATERALGTIEAPPLPSHTLDKLA
jgi:hypothetical protein